MMSSNSFQLYIRKFNYQIISKLLLVMFGAIMVGSGLLVLPRAIYIGVIVIYYAGTLLLMRKRLFREYSHVADLLFVMMILWGSPINNYLAFAFLMYPLVSRGIYIDKFTYDKYYILEYLVLLIIVDISSTAYSAKFYVYQVAIVFMFAMLNRMSVQRMRYDEKRIIMLDIADDYFVEQNKSYEVYRKIIEYLREQGINAKSITCFESDKTLRKHHLVNSSYLVSTWHLKLSRKDMESLLRGITANNVDFVLDRKNQEYNIVYPVVQTFNGLTKLLLFIVAYSNGTPPKLNAPNLEPFFLRMARLISFERLMRTKRDATIQDMIQKSRFVNGATNIMHFLKNRLTPLQTLVDLARNEGGVKQLDEYDSLLLDTANSAQKEINVILEKAQYLLNKQNNPFVFIKENCDAQSIFVTLSSIWSTILPSAPDMEVSMETEEAVVYESNMEGLEILFSDIIGNMNKYSKHYQRCVFRQDETGILTITFNNDFESKKEIEILISDINNPNKDAVIYRTSYGVTNIRAIAGNLTIGLKAGLVSGEMSELYQLELLLNPKR